MLESGRKLKRPEEHMPSRLRQKLPSIKISAERGETSESCAYSAAARVICTAEAAVMELRMLCCQRCYVRYVLRTAVSTPAAQRELRIPGFTELERENCCMKNFTAPFFWTASENCWILISIPQRSLHSRTGSKATPKRAKLNPYSAKFRTSSNGVHIPHRPD